MIDLVWDPIKRDMVFSPNGDFETTDSNSVISSQNGAVLLEARCMNILFPFYGIGYNSQVLGSATSEAAFQLNRWVSQCQSDGAKAAWSRMPNPPNVQFDFTAKVNYDL